MDTFNSLLTFLVLILDLLQGLEWLHKKVKALYHAHSQRKHR